VQFIVRLKKKLAEATDLYAVQHYYLDHAAELMGHGDAVQDSILEEVMRQSSRSALDAEVRIGNVLIKRIAEHGFLYGGFLVNGRPGSVFYFEDIQTGLLAVVGERDTSVVSRFRCEIRTEAPHSNN